LGIGLFQIGDFLSFGLDKAFEHALSFDLSMMYFLAHTKNPLGFLRA
jgi:hypothetical protein